MKKAIIFDFDNTIVMSIKYWKKVIEKETPKKYKVKENPDYEPIVVNSVDFNFILSFLKSFLESLSYQF